MKIAPTTQEWLIDATFTLALLLWITSIATMFWVGYMIAPFSIPLFIIGLAGHFTWRRAAIATLGTTWSSWMLWVALT